MASFYSQPTFAAGGGTADAPRLGATSDNIYGYDKTTASIVNALKQDAAQNGLTAWGFSFLKQLGETIKPEWLKENSREWFNKPLVDPLVPPKDDFLKIVEPAVITDQSREGWGRNVADGRVTEAIRDKGGFGGLWEKYHREVGDLEAQQARLPAYLDPKRIAERAAQFGPEGQALTPQAPTLRQQADADAAKLKADQEAYRAANSYKPIDEDNPPAGMTRQQARQRNREMNAQAEANFRAGHMGADDVLNARAGAPVVPAPSAPGASPAGQRFVPGGPEKILSPEDVAASKLWVQQHPDLQTQGLGSQALSANNFLPPYLQPGGGNNIAGGVQGVLNRYNTGGSVLPPNLAAPQQTINPLAPLAPVNPLMPAVGQIPLGMPAGSPFPTGTNLGVGGINTGGGFSATAKLLELPYYLRNLNKPRARAGVAAYG